MICVAAGSTAECARSSLQRREGVPYSLAAVRTSLSRASCVLMRGQYMYIVCKANALHSTRRTPARLGNLVVKWSIHLAEVPTTCDLQSLVFMHKQASNRSHAHTVVNSNGLPSSFSGHWWSSPWR
jgi:hypothetical protein